MPRQRGAQPGNANPRRHGYYSHIFRGQELADLDQALAPDLDDEIKLLRVLIRRTAELFDGVADVGEAIAILNSIAGSAARLSTLIYKKYLMTGIAGGKAPNELNGAIDRLRREGFYNGEPRPKP